MWGHRGDSGYVGEGPAAVRLKRMRAAGATWIYPNSLHPIEHHHDLPVACQTAPSLLRNPLIPSPNPSPHPHPSNPSNHQVKNGTPPQRKSALRQLTDKAIDFGPKALFDQILPLLMQPTLEDQERHLLVKVIDRWGGIEGWEGGG